MILYLFFYIIAWNLYRGDYKSFFGLSFIAHFVFLLFLFEFINGNVTYYISDGLRYITNPEKWIADKSRATWGYINYFEKYYDILGPTFAKIINIPLLLIFNKQLKNLFKVYLGEINIVMWLPYFFFLAISNLRDVFLMIVVIESLRHIINYSFNNLLKFLFYFFLVSTLRPFIAAVLLSVVIYFRFNILIKRRLYLYAIFFTGVFVLFFLQFDFYDRYAYNLNYYLNEGLEDRIVERKAEVLGSTGGVVFWIKSFLRYIFTPLPHSMILAAIEGVEKNIYGFTSLFLRIINQCVYLYSLLYIVFNFNYLKIIYKILNSLQKAFLFVCFSYLPIYSILHFGGVHQRTKLPFQVLVVIVFYLIFQYKKKVKNEKI